MEQGQYSYAQLLALLDGKYATRDEHVNQLLASGDSSLVYARAAQVRKHLLKKLIDPDIKHQILEYLPSGSLKCSGYTIEKVSIHCKSGYLIPVNVYVPQGSGKHPAIVVSIGHWPAGKNMEENQIFCANLALNGFVVATYDPICQGDRLPYSGEELKQIYGDLPPDRLIVNLHMQVGNLAYLLGKNVSALFASDSVAVVDYLCSRDDVDSNKLGCTGQSGGGTQTLYLSAVDDRICYVSPIQCLSKMSYMNPKGIGDCEQSPLGLSEEEGFDYPDLVWASFPKPVLMNAALHDSFLLKGAKESAEELARLYAYAPKNQTFKVKYADCEHEISAETRQFSYNWFCDMVLGTKAAPEKEINVFTNQELYALPTDLVSIRPQQLYNNIFLERQQRASNEWPEELVKTIEAILKETQVQKINETTISCKTWSLESTCLVPTGTSNYGSLSIGKKIKNALTMTPWAYGQAYHKEHPEYDLQTSIFNAAAVLGISIPALRLAHIIATLDFLSVDSIVVHATGEGALLAVLLHIIDKRVTNLSLLTLPSSYSQCFSASLCRISEMDIVPGLAAEFSMELLETVGTDNTKTAKKRVL